MVNLNEPQRETQDAPDDARPWIDALKKAETAFSKYNSVCDNVSKYYADLEKLSQSADRQFQIFWSNLGVLLPSIYSRAPKPVVVSRFKDRRELPRKASELLERSLSSLLDIEDMHDTLCQVRDDLGNDARGVAWLRYHAEMGEDGALAESVKFDHIFREDFLHEPARKWSEVGWVARRAWITREAGKQRFGEAWIDINYIDAPDTEDEYTVEQKAEVWEIWDKLDRRVIWVHPEKDKFLDVREPMIDVKGFFPCPRPAYATKERKSLIPVPDFLFYKDQIEEINELTARISGLAESLRMKGFYAAGAEDVSEAVETALRSTSNHSVLVPVPNMAAMGPGGMRDAIQWLPMKDVAETIMHLIALRKQVIDDVYQITGISDIMRGATEKEETLGAQQLKAQYGSVRVRNKQEEMVRIARDLIRMAGEVMAENFQPDTFLKMSQIDDLPQAEQVQQQIMQIEQQVEQASADPQMQQLAKQNPQQAQQMLMQAQTQIQTLQNTVTLEAVVAMFRQERVRPFILDIETDSTIQPDEQAEKQARGEFLMQLGNVLGQLAPLVGTEPKAAPFAGEILKFATGPYRVGRSLEQAIDDFVEAANEKSQQPPLPNPEIEMKKQEMEAKKELSTIDGDIKRMEADARRKEIALKAAHDERMMESNERLKQIELQIAELRLAEMQSRPVPKPNGDANAPSAPV